MDSRRERIWNLLANDRKARAGRIHNDLDRAARALSQVDERLQQIKEQRLGYHVVSEGTSSSSLLKHQAAFREVLRTAEHGLVQHRSSRQKEVAVLQERCRTKELEAHRYSRLAGLEHAAQIEQSAHREQRNMDELAARMHQRRTAGGLIP